MTTEKYQRWTVNRSYHDNKLTDKVSIGGEIDRQGNIVEGRYDPAAVARIYVTRNHYTKEEKAFLHCEFEVEIDMSALLSELVYRAARTASGKSTRMNGAVKVTCTKKERELKEVIDRPIPEGFALTDESN